jgi:phenylpropionate dioxygenase-like ring-hydroxylating dioxygenase large terminal subunit
VTDPLSRFLSLDERAALRAPIEAASPFPNIAYTSQEYFDLEVDRVFARNWVAVGFAPSLPRPGDVQPLWIFGFPILILRDDEGILRVFHNIGAHDGCPVVAERASGLQQLVGPYHGWTYDLKGRLIEAPYWDGHRRADLSRLRQRDVDLKEIRSGIWCGVVFINLSGGAPPLEEYLAPLIEFYADYDFSGLAMAFDSEDGDGVHRFRARANWKALWENYAPDVYHENFVHPMYRNSEHVPRVDKAGRKTYLEVNDRGLMGLAFETEAVPSTYPAVRLPKIRRKSDGMPVATSSIFNMYPNLAILVFPTRVRPSILIPNGPDACEWLLATFYADGAATDPAFRTERDATLTASAAARIEDDRVCEAVQLARRSPVFRKRFYSPFWDSMLYSFNRRVLDDLERA